MRRAEIDFVVCICYTLNHTAVCLGVAVFLAIAFCFCFGSFLRPLLLLPMVGVAELFTAGTAISWAANEVVVVVAVTVSREVTALVIAVLQLPGMFDCGCVGSGVGEAVFSLRESKSLFFELVEGKGARSSNCPETKAMYAWLRCKERRRSTYEGIIGSLCYRNWRF